MNITIIHTNICTNIHSQLRLLAGHRSSVFIPVGRSGLNGRGPPALKLGAERLQRTGVQHKEAFVRAS